MNKQKQLISDMADVIFKHGLEMQDPAALEVLERANYKYLPKAAYLKTDTITMIESIRQANLHPMAP